jgi:hypothetical protein
MAVGRIRSVTGLPRCKYLSNMSRCNNLSMCGFDHPSSVLIWVVNNRKRGGGLISEGCGRTDVVTTTRTSRLMSEGRGLLTLRNSGLMGEGCGRTVLRNSELMT